MSEYTTEALNILISKGNLPGESQSLTIQTLACELFEERAKPKVWDGAPEDTEAVSLYWGVKGTANVMPGPEYTRELPKSRARIIAERIAEKNGGKFVRQELASIIEAAINEALEGK